MSDYLKEISKEVAKYIIFILLGMIFMVSWTTAKDASCEVNKVRERVAVLESQLKDISEMKADIKRVLIRLGEK